MCVPDGGSLASMALSLTKDTISTIISHKKSQDNLEYRTQIAIKNAKSAQDEASRQKQIGIEAAREEKLNSIKKLSQIKAINSSNGFDLNSETQENTYEDILNSGESRSDFIKRKYDYSSDKYLKQANNYIDGINSYKKDNSSVFSNMYNALGKAQKVSNDWFSNKGGLI